MWNKQGRLEVFNDGFNWYAPIPVKVEINVIPRGYRTASIDLGIVNIATVAFDDGIWLLFKYIALYLQNMKTTYVRLQQCRRGYHYTDKRSKRLKRLLREEGSLRMHCYKCRFE